MQSAPGSTGVPRASTTGFQHDTAASPGNAGVPPASTTVFQLDTAVSPGSAGVPPASKTVGLRRVVHRGPPARTGGTPALPGSHPAHPFMSRPSAPKHRRAFCLQCVMARKPSAPLRRGWTTGACATAATKAAWTALLTGEFPDPVRITLPEGPAARFRARHRTAGCGLRARRHRQGRRRRPRRDAPGTDPLAGAPRRPW